MNSIVPPVGDKPVSVPDCLSIEALHRAYGQGLLAQDVFNAIEDRIAALNDPGIFISRPKWADLMEEVAALGRFDPVAKPLWGVPFAVKDNIDVAGLVTTAACPDYGYVPDRDSVVVRELRQAGAIVIGKTNLDQFATGLVGVRTPFAVPKNALDETLIPGGSSSGSAVAVARRFCTFSLGTDTAGSGRIPAGLNGLVGLKPSLGALSTSGVVPACRSLDCVSIFAASIADAVKVYDVAILFDEDDPYARTITFDKDKGIKKIGVPETSDRIFFGDRYADEAYSAFLQKMSEAGAEIIEIPFKAFYETARLLYEGPWVAERYAAIEEFFRDKPKSIHPVTKEIIGKAVNISAADTFKAIYRLKTLQRKIDHLIQGVDGLCVPTAPTWYRLDQVADEPIVCNSNLGTYTNFVNLLGLCGLTVPTGRQGDGRPASATFLGKDGDDYALARFAEQMVGTNNK